MRNVELAMGNVHVNLTPLAMKRRAKLKRLSAAGESNLRIPDHLPEPIGLTSNWFRVRLVLRPVGTRRPATALSDSAPCRSHSMRRATPAMIRSRVVLPLPDGPRATNTSPAAISKLTPAMIFCPPKLFDKPVTQTADRRSDLITGSIGNKNA